MLRLEMVTRLLVYVGVALLFSRTIECSSAVLKAPVYMISHLCIAPDTTPTSLYSRFTYSVSLVCSTVKEFLANSLTLHKDPTLFHSQFRKLRKTPLPPFSMYVTGRVVIPSALSL